MVQRPQRPGQVERTEGEVELRNVALDEGHVRRSDGAPALDQLRDELDRDDLANKRRQRESERAGAGARVEGALVAAEGQEVAQLHGQLAGSALLQRRDPISRRREPSARCVVRTQAPPPWM